MRRFIELRYRLLPYIYTSFWQHAETGAPMLRPLVYLAPEDPEVPHRDEEFALGDNLLTCPVSKPGRDGRWLYAPAGRWYNFWTDNAVEGGALTPLISLGIPGDVTAAIMLGSIRLLAHGDSRDE